MSFFLAQSFVDSIDQSIEIKNKYKDTAQKLENINKFIQFNKSVFIGISGLNNIGKTTLCKELKLKYGDSLIVIEDSFIGEVRVSSFEIALFCLINQVLEFNRLRQMNSNKVVYVFDRTPIDNFAYLMLHKSENHNQFDRYIERLEQEIKSFMLSFDIVAFLIPDKKADIKILQISIMMRESRLIKNLKICFIIYTPQKCMNIKFLNIRRMMISRIVLMK